MDVLSKVSLDGFWISSLSPQSRDGSSQGISHGGGWQGEPYRNVSIAPIDILESLDKEHALGHDWNETIVPGSFRLSSTVKRLRRGHEMNCTMKDSR